MSNPIMIELPLVFAERVKSESSVVLLNLQGGFALTVGKSHTTRVHHHTHNNGGWHVDLCYTEVCDLIRIAIKEAAE
tara:strand:+ start:449 stop:679 length:231 start_codon:yes stop_codon:yes gene_type:complete